MKFLKFMNDKVYLKLLVDDKKMILVFLIRIRFFKTSIFDQSLNPFSASDWCRMCFLEWNSSFESPFSSLKPNSALLPVYFVIGCYFGVKFWFWKSIFITKTK